MAYRRKKIRGHDAEEFSSRSAFIIRDAGTYRLFEKEFDSVNNLLFSKGPTFEEVIDRIRARSEDF